MDTASPITGYGGKPVKNGQIRKFMVMHGKMGKELKHIAVF
jgi:hypothetical protein